MFVPPVLRVTSSSSRRRRRHFDVLALPLRVLLAVRTDRQRKLAHRAELHGHLSGRGSEQQERSVQIDYRSWRLTRPKLMLDRRAPLGQSFEFERPEAEAPHTVGDLLNAHVLSYVTPRADPSAVEPDCGSATVQPRSTI